ncbi:UNVERIFIED_ORG: heme-degrading monooxygenase HmoA [Variovorax guangxiensis]
MFIRCAFFRGRVKAGMEEAFDRHVHERLVPLWTRFPGALEVRVLRQVESDVSDPELAMVLAIRWASREDIDRALESPVRYESREVSKMLFEMFDGTVFHTVFSAGEFALSAS